MKPLLEFMPITEPLAVDYLIVNLLDPLVDAGHVMKAVDYTIEIMDSAKIASFDSDQLYDYRAQRPSLRYEDGKISEFFAPGLQLDLVHDLSGKRFLYLGGQEPDFKWFAVADSILEIIDRFQVSHTLTLSAMQAAIPHTRSAGMLVRSSKLRPEVQYVPGKAEHFATLSDLLEYQAAKKDINVTNIRARVPFYLAQNEVPYFAGVLSAVKFIAGIGGPQLPLGDLEQLDAQQRQGFINFLENSTELQEVVRGLEADYDSNPNEANFTANGQELGQAQVPSLEEIGVAADRFLAQLAETPKDYVLSSKPESVGGEEQSPKAITAGEVTVSADLEVSAAGEVSTPLPDSEPKRRRGKHHY